MSDRRHPKRIWRRRKPLSSFMSPETRDLLSQLRERSAVFASECRSSQYVLARIEEQFWLAQTGYQAVIASKN